jgi:hypothetical protein
MAGPEVDVVLDGACMADAAVANHGLSARKGAIQPLGPSQKGVLGRVATGRANHREGA